METKLTLSMEEAGTIACALCTYIRNNEDFLDEKWQSRGHFAAQILEARRLLERMERMHKYAEENYSHIYERAEKVFRECFPERADAI